ncbi:MAG: hypothetical protein GY811_02800, partial [Myxococcales bacterium]|nr:hypothetical protein [Myxococcales bacterium]
MGTWDDGLYDSDSALDVLGDLFDTLDPTPGPAHLACAVGLLAQMSPTSLCDGEWPSRIKGSPHLTALPVDARNALETIARDPEAATEGSSRPPGHEKALGDYCDGPRIEALF